MQCVIELALIRAAREIEESGNGKWMTTSSESNGVDTRTKGQQEESTVNDLDKSRRSGNIMAVKVRKTGW